MLCSNQLSYIAIKTGVNPKVVRILDIQNFIVKAKGAA
jgi:hypothetical protein